MKLLLKPLTKKMIAHMRNARAIELSESDRNVCLANDFSGSLAGLYRRGYVTTRMVHVNGKEILGVFITQPGIMFLQAYQEEGNS